MNPLNGPQDPSLIRPLERVSNNNQNAKFYKYLGVLIDEYLNFNHHCEYVSKKLSRALFCLNRIKNTINRQALKTLYYALFQSHLLYCNIVFNCTSQSNLNKIITLQKKAIRSITNSPYNSHTGPLFLQLKILPFEKLLYWSRAMFIHSIYFKYNHMSFNNIWIINQQRDIEHSLRNQNLFHLPFPRTEQFKKSPLYFLPKTWNDLPIELKCQENPFTFKIATKNYLFNLLALECTELAQMSL